MIVFPISKINLGLNIVGVRPNGYHDIESVFLPIGLSDVLELTLPESCEGDYQLHVSGNAIDVPDEKNLVIKALRKLKGEVDVPPVGMLLHKIIPDGAGLGGGSSDAAFVLTTLNSLLGLGLSNDRLKTLAAQIGADCPFFVEGKPQYVTGIGDVFADVDVSRLKGLKVVLAVPNGSVSTAEAYANMGISRPDVCVCEAITRDISEWKDLISNDFESYVSCRLPDVAFYKKVMYDHGALYAQMSGSGSSVFGFFPTDADDIPTQADFPGTRCYWSGQLNL